MPDSFEALGVVVLALLPGALYVWSFERLVGRWGIGLADRALRFVGGSAAFHVVFLPITFSLWTRFGRDGQLGELDRLPPSVWLACIAYAAIPTFVGTLSGVGTRRRWRWTRLLTGPEPAPRAWDHLFSSRPDGWIRLRMKSGTWLGGAYAAAGDQASYAAGYPEAGDLYLADATSVDPDTGEFDRDETGEVIWLGSGILVKWEDVEYLVFIEA